MVKNGMGGNKAKKNASKNFNIYDRNVRFSSCLEEKYAVVTKMLGNNMCNVLCIDGKDRQCIIRGKFSGKGKRQNKLSKGIWVLVGIRDWEISSKNRCDLLEVYSESDRHKIIKNENYDFTTFWQYDENNNFEDNLNFVNIIECDDEEEDDKSDDYFKFESSDSESEDKAKNIELNVNSNNFLEKSENIKIIDKFGEIDLDDI